MELIARRPESYQQNALRLRRIFEDGALGGELGIRFRKNPTHEMKWIKEYFHRDRDCGAFQPARPV
jgi:hypothetical protein